MIPAMQGKPSLATDMDLRDVIQQIAMAELWPAAHHRGTPTTELGGESERVYRILREDNLLCVRKRKFVSTTDSNHDRKLYPNLARQIVSTSVDQLWRADITYIRLQDEFVYLAVILDAYSRTALRMAIARRIVQPGIVHHSDRGSQYATNDYTDLLKEHGIEVSMSRKATPWDNAACESFMKILKYEEVYRNEYRNLDEAHAAIHEFLEKVYNRKRLHSALGYLPPVEFERKLAASNREAVSRQPCL
jgi:putative transposase